MSVFLRFSLLKEIDSSKDIEGTTSSPPELQGPHFRILLRIKKVPLNRPFTERAWTAYSEQEGKNRQ